MKTKTKGLLVLSAVLACTAIGLTACDAATPNAIDDQKHQLGDVVSDHQYGENENVVDATCTTDGSYTQTCADCGYTKTVVVPATGHELSESTVDATCDAAGSVTESCADCDYEASTPIAKLDHTWENVAISWEGNEATVTGTCSTCTDCELNTIATVTVAVEDTSSCVSDGAIIATATVKVDGIIIATDTKVTYAPQKSHYDVEYTYDENQHWQEVSADCDCAGVEVEKVAHAITSDYDLENGKTIYSCTVCDWTETGDTLVNSNVVLENNKYLVATPVAKTVYYDSYGNTLYYDAYEGAYEVGYDYTTWSFIYKTEEELVQGEDYETIGTVFENNGSHFVSFVAAADGHYTFSVPENSFANVCLYVSSEYCAESYYRLCPTDASADGASATLILAKGDSVTIEVGIADAREATEEAVAISYEGDYYVVELNYEYENLGLSGTNEAWPLNKNTDGFEAELVLNPGYTYYYNFTSYNTYEYKTLNIATTGEYELYVDGELVDASEAIRFNNESGVVVAIKNVGGTQSLYALELVTYENPDYALSAGSNTISVPVADLAAGISLHYTPAEGEKFTFAFGGTSEAQQLVVMETTYYTFYAFGYNSEDGSFVAESTKYSSQKAIKVSSEFAFEGETVDIVILVNSIAPGTETNPVAVSLSSRTMDGYEFKGYASGEITLPAGASYYYTVSNNADVYAGDVMVTVDGTVALTVGEDAIVLDENGCAIYAVADSAAYVFTNSGDAEVTFTWTLESYIDNKDDLKVRENVLRLSEDDAKGYDMTFTADKWGNYTFNTGYLTLSVNGITVNADSSFTVEMNANDVLNIVASAAQAGVYELNISFAIPNAGNKDNLIVGKNIIELDANQANYGYGPTFFTATVAGEYTFAVPAGADAFVDVNASDASIEADGSYVATLAVGDTVEFFFCSYSCDAATYELNISVVQAAGSLETGIIVGDNVITLTDDNGLWGETVDFTAGDAGQYVITVSEGTDFYVEVDAGNYYGGNNANLQPGFDTTTVTLEAGEIMPINFASYNGGAATYTVTITYLGE